MEGSERDSTQDWLLPESARPPLLAELAQRIDEAVATARASEAAVMAVGAAALDAAEQARRAAELAERASAAVLDAQPAMPAAHARRRAPQPGPCRGRQPAQLHRAGGPDRGAAAGAGASSVSGAAHCS